ncbi:hypothetical protein AB9P05_10420 [Roseivirga sp. BDSF3-8]|uniref:hypothetical protein n=1 Tax=Roseivirga sp. BDSF3-8 TaxID=3241598 RepID=UPI0035325E42
MSDKKKSIERSTAGGRLYKTTEDFFSQRKIQETIRELMESDIYKDIIRDQQAAAH